MRTVTRNYEFCYYGLIVSLLCEAIEDERAKSVLYDVPPFRSGPIEILGANPADIHIDLQFLINTMYKLVFIVLIYVFTVLVSRFMSSQV